MWISVANVVKEYVSDFCFEKKITRDKINKYSYVALWLHFRHLLSKYWFNNWLIQNLDKNYKMHLNYKILTIWTGWDFFQIAYLEKAFSIQSKVSMIESQFGHTFPQLKYYFSYDLI